MIKSMNYNSHFDKMFIVCVALLINGPQVTTLTTNDIVINKLTQILSYLRQGARMGKKGRKRDRGLAAKGLPKEDLLPELPKTEDRYGCMGSTCTCLM